MYQMCGDGFSTNSADGASENPFPLALMECIKFGETDFLQILM
jgi:hypothetical protein